jgi:predicted molibdopterin-dependent oxidoreductase YjgC
LQFDELLRDFDGGKVSAAYVTHNGPDRWLNSQQIASLAKAPLLIAQDILASELSRAANVILPGASFAEKDGMFVNHSGLAQMIKRSIRCPAEGYTDGRIFMELSGRTGLFNARVIREEMGRAIEYFATLAVGDLGDFGVRLEQHSAAPAVQERIAK